jgi:hypothetical protein
MTISPKAVGNIATELLVNIALPYLIYVKAEVPIGQVHALLAASIPPILWSAIEFARKRRLDAVSILVLVSSFPCSHSSAEARRASCNCGKISSLASSASSFWARLPSDVP